MLHFISGLPRSGSTVLAAILSQNPDVHASIQSPLGQLVTGVQELMSPYVNESAGFLSETQRIEILRGLFRDYYDGHGYPDVVFDTNRRWCAHLGLLHRLFPLSRVIACVRPVAEIVDSFERLFQRDPTQISSILRMQNTTLQQRVSCLMDGTNVVGFSLNALHDAYAGAYKAKLCVIEYNDLINNPEQTLRDLHKTLDIPWFGDYDFDALTVLPGTDEFDRQLGTPGLHNVYRGLRRQQIGCTAIPAALAASLPQSFWRVNA